MQTLLLLQQLFRLCNLWTQAAPCALVAQVCRHVAFLALKAAQLCFGDSIRGLLHLQKSGITPQIGFPCFIYAVGTLQSTASPLQKPQIYSNCLSQQEKTNKIKILNVQLPSKPVVVHLGSFSWRGTGAILIHNSRPCKSNHTQGAPQQPWLSSATSTTPLPAQLWR